MDPITHTLTGAALSRAGLSRTTPLATAALVVAANAPDIDILAYRAGEYAALSFRRGWTHGPLAVLVLPFAVAGGVWLWDRLVRRRRDPARSPVRGPALLLVSFIGVLSHPVLDWLNTYGVRWLMPFDSRWFYGDAVFIIDPWLWLIPGGALFLAGGRSGQRLGGWALLGGLLSVPVLVAPMVPAAAKVLWLAGLLGLAALWRRPAPRRPYRLVRAALVVAGVYIVAMIGGSTVAERGTRAIAQRGGLDPVDVLFQPSPANPFAGRVVVATDTAYHVGSFSWFGQPRVMLPQTIVRGDTTAPAVAVAMRDRDVRDYLVWSRFPIVRVVADDDGEASVFVGDARYSDASETGGGLGGVRVRVRTSQDAAVGRGRRPASQPRPAGGRSSASVSRR